MKRKPKAPNSREEALERLLKKEETAFLAAVEFLKREKETDSREYCLNLLKNQEILLQTLIHHWKEVLVLGKKETDWERVAIVELLHKSRYKTQKRLEEWMDETFPLLEMDLEIPFETGPNGIIY